MTPNEQLQSNNSVAASVSAFNAAKGISTICLLAGIWFFVSPWVYGAYTNGNSWNNWIIGGFMILFAAIRMSKPSYSSAFSWFNMILGIWAFFSPWIYGYASVNEGRFINSLCVGVVVFFFSIASARLSGPRHLAVGHP